MSVLEETKFLMKKYKIKANKNLGQNFLIDDTVIEDIVNRADIKKDDLVIEIGPGLGSMTALLVKKAKMNSPRRQIAPPIQNALKQFFQILYVGVTCSTYLLYSSLLIFCSISVLQSLC